MTTDKMTAELLSTVGQQSGTVGTEFHAPKQDIEPSKDTPPLVPPESNAPAPTGESDDEKSDDFQEMTPEQVASMRAALLRPNLADIKEWAIDPREPDPNMPIEEQGQSFKDKMAAMNEIADGPAIPSVQVPRRPGSVIMTVVQASGGIHTEYLDLDRSANDAVKLKAAIDNVVEKSRQ